MAPKNQRWWLTADGVSIDVKAPAEVVYDLVADMPRMGEWSPECQRLEWTGGTTGPSVNATFIGHNRGGPFGLMRWSRRGRVLSADRGREFAFVTEEGGHESTVWRYRFEPNGDHTHVTESYEVRKIPLWARVVDVPTNRHRELLEGMQHTLAQLRSAAEAAMTERQTS
jgi:Polyketide cyclase / dehydrase and lipid transport